MCNGLFRYSVWVPVRTANYYCYYHVHLRSSDLLGVVGLLLALRARLAGAGLLPELLQTALQLQLLLTRLAQLPRLLAVHGLQLAAQLPLLSAQLPEPGRLAPAQRLQLLGIEEIGEGGQEEQQE